MDWWNVALLAIGAVLGAVVAELRHVIRSRVERGRAAKDAAERARWRTEPRVSRGRPGSCHMRVYWLLAEPAWDVSLTPSAGVSVTTHGGGSRRKVLTDERVEAVYRWPAEITDPSVTIEWREEPSGKLRSEEIKLVDGTDLGTP